MRLLLASSSYPALHKLRACQLFSPEHLVGAKRQSHLCAQFENWLSVEHSNGHDKEQRVFHAEGHVDPQSAGTV